MNPTKERREQLYDIRINGGQIPPHEHPVNRKKALEEARETAKDFLADCKKKFKSGKIRVINSGKQKTWVIEFGVNLYATVSILPR